MERAGADSVRCTVGAASAQFGYISWPSSAGPAKLCFDRPVCARSRRELRERELEDVVALLRSSVAAVGGTEVGHDPRLVLRVAELTERRGRFLEEANRPDVVAGVAHGEGEVGLRQCDAPPIAERPQDLEGLAVVFDGLVVVAAATVLRPGSVEADRLALGVE